MPGKILKDIYIYGTQFFRPPSPPAEQRIRDLNNVKKMGFNLIKIFAEWNWINYEEDTYDFIELEEIIQESKRLDILVDINIRIENAPYWVAEKFPDSHYVDSRGKKIELQARSNTPTGGWPGLCYDHPGARLAAEKFFIECARVLGKYDNALIFDCWNEPHIEGIDGTGSTGIGDLLFCYCESTVKKYQDWLEKEYKTIGNINESWYKKYRNFKDIKPPRKLIDYVEVMEWRKFMTWSMAEQMAWRYRTLKNNLGQDKIVMSHTVSHGILNGFSLLGCDDYQLSEHLDLFGLTLYPKWANSDAYDVVVDIDATISMSRGKACISAELQGGECICNPTGLSRSKIPQKNDFRQWVFTNIAFGIKGIVYWHYRAEMLGHEAPGTGINKRDGSSTYRSEEVSKLANFVNKYPRAFNGIKIPEGDIAIVINRDSLYLNFSSERNEDFSTNSIRGIHRFLLKNGLKADFIIDEMLEDKLKNYRLAFMPVPLVMDKKIADILEKYVREGGILISDCAVGYFNKFGVSQETVPSYGLENVFGARQDELRQFDVENREEVITDFWPPHHKISPKADIYFKGTGEFESNKIKLNFFFENYLTSTAKPIMEHEGKVAGTVNAYKKGRAYMIGTLATQLLLFDDEAIEKVFEKILLDEGYVLDKSNNLIIRDFLQTDGSTNVLFIINPGKTKSFYRYDFQKVVKITDYYDCEGFNFKLSGNILEFEIGPEDASCLIYKD